MGKVVVVGSVNVDISTRVAELPLPGQTLLGTDAAIRPGGKGANQAVAAARLGATTHLVAAIGADDFGAWMLANLADAGVDSTAVGAVPGTTTGLALIVVAADGENSIVVAPGANAALDPSCLENLVLVRGDVLVLQLEVPLATCLAAATAAQDAGAIVQLNAAPPAKPGDPTSRALLSRTNVLVVNETEATDLAGVAAPDDVDGWRALAAGLGAAACVITLGRQGAVAFDGEITWWQRAFPASVVDTTGAGDAFCGALAQSLAAGHDLQTGVRQACAAGAFATSRQGAQTALPTTEQLAALLAAPASAEPNATRDTANGR